MFPFSLQVVKGFLIGPACSRTRTRQEQEPEECCQASLHDFLGGDFQLEQLLYLKISVFHLQKKQSTALSD